MNLLDLPSDILYIIWDLVPADDFDALLLVCRKAYDIAAEYRLPDHRNFRSRYNHIILQHRKTHPANVLHEIWQDSRVTEYIRHIDVFINGHLGGRAWEYSYESFLAKQQIAECVDDVLGMSGQSVGSSWLPEEFHERLRWGCEITAFWLLLPFLRSMSHLCVVNNDWKAMMLQDYLWDWVNAHRPNGLPSSPWSNLQTVEVRHSSSRLCQDFDNLAIWVLLFPSLKRFIAQGLMCDERHPFSMFSCHRYSHTSFESSMETLELSQSLLDCTHSSGIKSFFKALSKLTTFHYGHGDHFGEVPLIYFELKSLVDILADTVSGSLRNLSITGVRTPTHPIDDLRCLQMLEHLEIDAISFYAGSESFVAPSILLPALVDILPQSLKTLAISLKSLGHEEKLRLFACWEGNKQRNLPDLYLVTYDGGELPRDLREQIQRTGVALQEKPVLFPISH